MRTDARTVSLALVAVLIGVWVVLRVVSLDETPPGFHYDEATISTHLICVGERFESAFGERFPLFTRLHTGQKYDGPLSPLYMYSGALWSRMFGPSIRSMRGHTAFYGLVAVALLFAIGRALSGNELGLWMALAGVLSPWSFQLSRLAWDSSAAPTFLLGAILCVVRGSGTASRVLAALLLAATMYTYPPAQVVVPLLVGAWLGHRLVLGQPGRRLPTRADWALLAVLAACMLVLAAYQMADDVPSRFARVGFTNKRYLIGFDQPWPLDYLLSFLHKFALHLDPSFLFTAGDSNLRHSPSGFGQWSWLDAWAWIAGIGALAVARRGNAVPSAPAWLLAGCAFGYLAGIVPAALTHEGLPHALRAYLAWPFLAIASGLLLHHAAERVPALRFAHLAVAIAFSAAFVPHYWGAYREEARGAFLDNLVQQARAANGDFRALVDANPRRSEPTLRWYLIAFGGFDCEGSAREIHRLRPNPHPKVAPVRR